MPDPGEPKKGDDLAEDAKTEFMGMAKEGLSHPSTAPVLTGAVVGGIAGAVIPFVSVPLGVIAGAGFMFYKRLRP